MATMLDGEDGGYYPCTGLNEGVVCAGTGSVRLGLVYCDVRYMHRHIFDRQGPLAGAWYHVVVVLTAMCATGASIRNKTGMHRYEGDLVDHYLAHRYRM